MVAIFSLDMVTFSDKGRKSFSRGRKILHHTNIIIKQKRFYYIELLIEWSKQIQLTPKPDMLQSKIWFLKNEKKCWIYIFLLWVKLSQRAGKLPIEDIFPFIWKLIHMFKVTCCWMGSLTIQKFPKHPAERVGSQSVWKTVGMPKIAAHLLRCLATVFKVFFRDLVKHEVSWNFIYIYEIICQDVCTPHFAGFKGLQLNGENWLGLGFGFFVVMNNLPRFPNFYI